MINLWVFICTIFISVLSVNAQNILTNAGFESDFTNWEERVANTDYAANFNISTSEIHSGSKAAHVEVTKVASDYWAFKYHNIRLKQQGFSVQDADVLRLSFWAKYAGSDLHPMIQAGVAKNATENTDFWELEDYDMSNFLITEQWKQYEMELIITQNPGSDIMFLLRFGGMVGDYYVDDVVLEVVDNLSSENDWLSNYQSRIDTLRKGNLELVILDKDGQYIPSCDVQVNLLRHNFQWGTAVRYVTPLTFNSSDRVWERKEIQKIFNTIVNENDFKWPEVEPNQNSVNYDNVNLYLDWKDSVDFQFRGHCLYWTKQMWMPSWWPGLSTQDKIDAVKTRCSRDVSYFAGRVPEYDVVNEPVHFTYVEDEVGDSIYRISFQQAHQADSQAILYVNDWWNIDKWDSWRLRKWIEKRLAEGTPVHGIGFQGHWDNERVDWREVKFKSDYFAELGMPLKITEFDMDYNRIGLTRVQQAEDYGKLMRLVFSHPAYEGFLIWGLQDGWRNDAGIYNDDKTPRPSRDTMMYWIKEQWTTTENKQTDATGLFAYNGYYGDYQVVVDYESVKDTFYINFSDTSKNKQLITKFDYSLGTENMTAANNDLFEFSVYPNPVYEKCNIELENVYSEEVRVKLYSLHGELLYNYLYPSDSDVTLNLSWLSGGVYIISVSNKDYVSMKKIIVK